MKKEIRSRKDVNFLVNAFYAKVREDEMLGPIFNSIVQDWPEHLERLTDFWETNLLFVRAYKGNPLQVHIEVDRIIDNRVTQEHFGRWIQLWFATLDEHFTGKNAETAKRRARKMSTMMFLNIFNGRLKKQS